MELSLLLDGTSPSRTKVSLWQNLSLLAQCTDTNETPARVIEKVLHHSQLHLHDLTFLAWIRGPGSYTGLRVIAAALKALSLKFPIISADIFEISVSICQHSNPALFIPIINARKNEYFMQVFLYESATYRALSAHTLLYAHELVDFHKNYAHKYALPVYFLPIQLADALKMDTTPLEHLPSKTMISWDTDYTHCIQVAQKCMLVAYEKKSFTRENALLPLYFKPPHFATHKG